jgi:hypothetical protein
MTIETNGQPQDEGDCPPPPTNPNCDPHLIDEVACKASGVAAQAAYNATYQPLLDKAKVDYDATRKDYRAKRHDAMLQVQDMRHQIKHLIERIRCQIEQKRVWRCLDEAFCEIVEELECCDTSDGCCAEECEFDVECAEALDCQLVEKLIVDYQRQTDNAKDCFNRLVGEPAALEKRVAAAKDAIAKINAALGDDPAKTDLKRVYAQAIVAKREIDRIWGGFDQTHDFVDCLCRALTCWTKGCAAVSVLTGVKAVCDCHDKAGTARCEHLKSNTVDEVLAMYDKLCPQRETCDDAPQPEPKDCDDEPEHPDHPKHGNCGGDGEEHFEECEHCGHRHPRHD